MRACLALSLLVATPPAFAGGPWDEGVASRICRLEVPSFGERTRELGAVRLDQEQGYTIAFESREVLAVADAFSWSAEPFWLGAANSTCVIPVHDGFVFCDGLQATRYRVDVRYTVCPSPDGRRLAFWTQTPGPRPLWQVAVLDFAQLRPGEPPSPRVVYEAHGAKRVGRLRWGPGSKCLLVVQHELEPGAPVFDSALVRVPLDEGLPREVVRTSGLTQTRAVSGSGGGVLGLDTKGLFQVEGSTLWRFARFPANRVARFEVSPNDPELALVLLQGPRGHELCLADLDGRDDAPSLELWQGHSVVTFGFSPQGSFVHWTTGERGEVLGSALHVARVDDPRQRIVIRQPAEDGKPLPILGVELNPEETQLAYTAGGRVFVYDLASGQRVQIGRFEPSQKASKRRFPVNPAAFQPRWRGGQVLVAVWEWFD